MSLTMTLVGFLVGLVVPVVVVVAPLAAGTAEPPRRLRSTVVHPPGCFGAGAGSSAFASFVGFAAATGPFGFAAGVVGPACLECIRVCGGEVRRATFVVVAGGEEEEVVVAGSRLCGAGGGPQGVPGGSPGGGGGGGWRSPRPHP